MTDYDFERELIAKAVENPTDDAPRLAYADWLESHGQEARARIIRVQCQLEHLKSEEKALIDQYGMEWGEDLCAQRVTEWTFHRGFPEEIRIPIDDFLDNHTKISALTPVSRITLTHVSNDALLGQFVTLPTIQNLQALDVGHGNGRFGPAGILALCKSPYLKNLKELSLHSPHIGEDGARIICQAPFIKNLTKLVIYDPHLEREHKLFAEVVKALNPNIIEMFKWGNASRNNVTSFLFNTTHPSDERGTEGLRR